MLKKIHFTTFAEWRWRKIQKVVVAVSDEVSPVGEVVSGPHPHNDPNAGVLFDIVFEGGWDGLSRRMILGDKCGVC
jgi:hypothetical protein